MSIEATLDVDPGTDAVAFDFRVRNTGDDPVDLGFRSGKEMDVVVEDQADGAVWRWSEGRMFTQALSSRTLDPGEEAAYEATWTEPEPGTYRARATLAADRDVAAEAAFSVP